MNPGTSFSNLLLLLQLALLPVVAQEEEILSKAGDTVELPCRISEKKKVPFNWKNLSGTKVLAYQDMAPLSWVTGTTRLQTRVESKQLMWKQGYFPLIIRDLQTEDSGPYLCEVLGETTKVKLMVFKLKANVDIHSSIRLLPGDSLTLTLEGDSDSDLLVEWKDPENKKHHDGKSFSLSWSAFLKSGTWTCTVSKNGKMLVFNINILVLAFQKASNTVYAKDGEKMEFSSPLTFEDVNLQGKLMWQGEKASSPETWITFSLKNKTVSVKGVLPGRRKLQMRETTPLHFSLPQALLQDAGSGNLTLTLGKGQLHQEVKLVVMKMTKSQSHLICEVLGPSSPELELTLILEDQAKNISSQQKMVKVEDPESGTWQCLLSDKNKVLLKSKVEVSPTVFTWAWAKLAIVVGSIVGFLIFAVFFIICCVKCWHRRRQAQRMSHIKRLLSEKKTCQCPHRFPKTHSFI